ncbi:MAG: biopolymer transporter ExbD [Flavobacteriales bacterium]|nr:biopolymer transporter ExbD [Flavobacteriales bacterium]
MRRKIEEINTGSMADIAFLLLIFFLVVTTIETKKGIGQELPPITDEGARYAPRNILTILVNDQDQLLVEGQILLPIAELKELVKTYYQNQKKDPGLPESVEKFIPGLGNRMVSKQVISLQNDMETNYGIYVQIHSILRSTLKELRNEAAVREYGVSYEMLKKQGAHAKVSSIKSLIPFTISEAKPIKT